MKLIPILFSTPMVLSIYNGSKGQTRLIVKPQPPKIAFGPAIMNDGIGKTYATFDNLALDAYLFPYGQIGDVLWVRETWQWLDLGEDSGYVYKASENGQAWATTEEWKWKPSIFMPFNACRLFLEITDIRIERLQNISEADAIAEGVGRTTVTRACSGSSEELRFQNYGQRYDIHHPMHRWCMTAKHSYQTLWEEINGKDSWEANPFVWVVNFKQIEKP